MEHRYDATKVFLLELGWFLVPPVQSPVEVELHPRSVEHEIEVLLSHPTGGGRNGGGCLSPRTLVHGTYAVDGGVQLELQIAIELAPDHWSPYETIRGWTPKFSHLWEEGTSHRTNTGAHITWSLPLSPQAGHRNIGDRSILHWSRVCRYGQSLTH